MRNLKALATSLEMHRSKGSSRMMNWAITTTLAIVFVLSLVPILGTYVTNAANNTNMSGAPAAIIGLITLIFFAIFIMKLVKKK